MGLLKHIQNNGWKSMNTSGWDNHYRKGIFDIIWDTGTQVDLNIRDSDGNIHLVCAITDHDKFYELEGWINALDGIEIPDAMIKIHSQLLRWHSRAWYETAHWLQEVIKDCNDGKFPEGYHNPDSEFSKKINKICKEYHKKEDKRIADLQKPK